MKKTVDFPFAIERYNVTIWIDVIAEISGYYLRATNSSPEEYPTVELTSMITKCIENVEGNEIQTSHGFTVGKQVGDILTDEEFQEICDEALGVAE
jgi:hypothetical protein